MTTIESLKKPAITIISESELRELVVLDQSVLECIDSAFVTLAGGNVVMPPILSMSMEEFNGELDVKTAYVQGVPSFAIKMAPGFYDNPKLGLPSTSGLMIVFSARTGMTEALLLDNGYLTEIRTAAAGALAARYLSRQDSETACIVGAGSQARLQLEALSLVRPIKRASFWARDFEKATVTAAQMSAQLSIDVDATQDIEKSVRAADIVVTTTPSTMPLIKADWLCPGHHVTAMGSDQEDKNELEPACLKRADLYVPDKQSQTQMLGELHHAVKAGIVPSDTVFVELGAIAAGHNPGRASSDEITICDLTGTGVQDTAIATYARQRALAAGIGIEFNS